MLLTHSGMKLYNTCPKAFEYRYINKLVRPIEHRNAASALRFGSIVHQGLANHWRGRPLFEGIKVLKSHVDDAEELLINDVDKCDIVIEDLQALAMIEAYHEYYNNDAEEYEVESIEAPFETDNYKGQVDGVIFKDGVRMLLEHKTASKVDYTYWAHLNIDMQIRLYCNAIKAETVLYDVLIKPAIRIKKSETVEEFINRYKKEITFERRILYLADEDINGAMDDARVIRRQIEAGVFPKHRSACCSVAGSCPYFNLCANLCDKDVFETKEPDSEVTGKVIYRGLR